MMSCLPDGMAQRWLRCSKWYALCTLAGALVSLPTWGQTGKPVQLVVPYPAGGPSDTVARLLAGPLSSALQQSVVVENLAGAGGTLAAQKVQSAPADGHQWLQGSPNEVILAPLALAAAKVRAEDFRLVHPVAEAVLVVVARGDLPARTMDELLALARTSDNKPLTFGSPGVGSLYHLIAEDVQAQAGVRLNHIPYRGNTPLLQDLGGGQLDLAILAYHAALGALADQGRLKLIAQLGTRRAEALPQVPTVLESVARMELDFQVWTGVMVPTATPEPTVQRIHSALVQALQNTHVQSQVKSQAQSVSKPMTLEDATRFFDREVARYRSIAQRIRLQPQ